MLGIRITLFTQSFHKISILLKVNNVMEQFGQFSLVAELVGKYYSTFFTINKPLVKIDTISNFR